MKTNKNKQMSLINDFKSKIPIKNVLFIACSLLVVIGIITLGSHINNIGLVSNSITVIVIAGLFGLLMYDCKNHTYSKSWYPTIGMFGTFVGIYIGLMGFDTTDIGTSLPDLLDGLKMAFVTSIAGVVFSMIRTGLSKLGISPIVEKSEYDQLEQMNDNFDVFIKKIGKNFGNQLQEGLAEALNNLTDDISSKFTESIDNFTVAVARLSYQVEVLSNLQETYDNQMKQMNEVADKTTNMLTNISENIEKLDKPLKAIKDLGDKSVGAIDSLKTIPESMSSVNTLIDDATNKINVMTEEYKNSTNRFFEKVSVEHNTQLVEAGNYAAGIVQKLATDFENVTKALENASKTLPDSIEELKKRIDDVVKDNKKKNK